MLSCTEAMKNYRITEWFRLLKAEPNFLLKRWRKPRACFFLVHFHFLQVQREKMTLLSKKLFLMSISMKNGKKPEMQHPASENMQQGLAVPWPMSHPAPSGRHQRDHNDRAMQGKEKRQKST